MDAHQTALILEIEFGFYEITEIVDTHGLAALDCYIIDCYIFGHNFNKLPPRGNNFITLLYPDMDTWVLSENDYYTRNDVLIDFLRKNKDKIDFWML